MGIIWKKSLRVSPLSSLSSDTIRVSLSTPLSNMQSSIIVLCAYLPICDHPIEEFTDCLNKFVSVISALEADGPILILGDFNAHLSIPRNSRGDLLYEGIRDCNLFIASSSCIANGPGYTFFSGDRKSTVDYILLNTFLSASIVECYTHGHNDLNFSDHFPIPISLEARSIVESPTTTPIKINWKKATQKNPSVN